MIVSGSPPPYRASPQSLQERAPCSSPFEHSLDIRTRNDMTAGNFKKNEKRPKSSPVKISKTPCGMNSKGDSRRNAKDNPVIKRIESAFGDKGAMYLKVQPGYMIAKRKSGISVTLNMDELWAGATKERHKCLPVQDQRDIKIKKLQLEIDELKAILAEEKTSHRSDFRQFVENTKIDVEIMVQEHRDHISTIEEDHELELENLKAFYEAKINAEKEEAQLRETQMQEEIDAVKETLETCKEEVNANLEEKWMERKEKLLTEQDLKTEQLLKEQRLKLKSERIAAFNDLTQQQAREIESIEETHRKEINALHEKFAVCEADAENLKIVALEAEKLEEDLKDLQDTHAKTKEMLRKTKNELADAKVQLQGYELSFSEKVAEVEERYSMKIQGLMLNNTDIRRNYMKKCAEFLDVQNKNESPKERKSSDPKTTMKTIILARTKADVSLVTTTRSNGHQSPKRALSPIRRPSSAPTFKPELSEEDNLFLTVAEFRTYRPNSSLA